MDHRKIFAASILLLLLFVSLACSLIGGQSSTIQPTLSADPTSLTETETNPSIYVTAITAGGTHACALLSSGKVKCWGSNDSGQLGDGTQTDSNIPVEVLNLADVTSISAGGAHTCALISTGEVNCWGQNTSGQLGDDTNDKRVTPVTVSGLIDVVTISAGLDHTCVITKEGEAKCWGKNLYGRIGDGSNTRLIPSPVTVKGLDVGVLAIAPGDEHTCAVTQGGIVRCWGNNGYGQLGDNTTKNHNSPTNVIGLTNGTKTLETGSVTSCAVTETHSGMCWGWIGLQDYYLSPHQVNGLERDIVSITAGGDHICGLTLDGVVKCLGENAFGQLGNGTTSAVYTANNVKGLSQVKSITANFNYTCVLVSSGEVFCWGSNNSGQLGNGTNTDSSEPVQVVGLIQ